MAPGPRPPPLEHAVLKALDTKPVSFVANVGIRDFCSLDLLWNCGVSSQLRKRDQGSGSSGNRKASQRAFLSDV